MSAHTISVRTNLIVFAALLVLLGATVGAAYLDLGYLNFPVAMAIATTKAVLIMLYFMHLRYSAPINWVAAVAALLWLGILLVLTLSDYLTRGWLESVGR